MSTFRWTPRVTVGALVVLLAFSSSLRADDPVDPNARLIRLERWIKTSLAHHPGERDDAVTEVSLWSNAELRVLRFDVAVLVRLFRSAGLSVPARATQDRNIPPYTPWQIRHFRALADEYSPRNKNENILVRGAVLHGDVAMSNPAPVLAPGTPDDTARLKVMVGDGESIGLNNETVHWEMARSLFDLVKGNPAAADVARRWYGATAMQMQDTKQHDTIHLRHARELFPEDADILFMSGTQQEIYASPAIQAAARTAVLPTGFHVTVGSEADDLRSAEGFFRHVLMLNAQHQEARLHLGRVLVARGRHQEAAEQLRQVTFPPSERSLRYFAALFLGAAEEGSGQFERARAAYETASSIVPGAQSPYLALSALATRRGDRATALKHIQRVFDLPPLSDDADPWWAYDLSHTRSVDARLAAVDQAVEDYK